MFKEHTMPPKTNYYKPNRDDAFSIYDIWENGGNRGDSVTPSTWSSSYQHMMTMTLLRYAQYSPNPRLLSLGCGNAKIESFLIKRGIDVFGVDINSEAVAYAKQKCVPAQTIDFYQFEPPDSQKYGLIYADGFFGHLYDDNKDVLPIYRRIIEKFCAPAAFIIVSNDAPRQSGGHCEPHPMVSNFFFLAPEYLARTAEVAGLTNIEINYFYYSRPVSGRCPRAIVISQFNSAS